ncbi:MAG TPA: hypothetical protein VHB21_01445 [Minicystis sp.]|nr:hypothetical protein [Minicystis sp.]
MTGVNLAALAAGVQVRASASRHVEVDLEVCSKCPDGCVVHELDQPRLIAVGRDPGLMPRVQIDVGEPLLKGEIDFGEDAVFELGRPAPGGESVGEDEATLLEQMAWLPEEFGREDAAGVSARLVRAFQSKRSALEIYRDPALDAAVAQSVNFVDFANRVVAAPGTPGASTRTRVHGALEDAGWDVNAARTVRDLGLVAFNHGSQMRRTGDYANGLTLAIDGVAHGFVFVQSYRYQSCKAEYTIGLRFVLLDVFGLDDQDLATFGAANTWRPREMRGFTAWWQLQHQFGYAPPITKVVVERSFTVSTKRD